MEYTQKKSPFISLLNIKNTSAYRKLHKLKLRKEDQKCGAGAGVKGGDFLHQRQRAWKHILN